MEKFRNICFGVIALIITSIIRGFVFYTLWGWLIVSTFEVQPITVIQAIGISFFISYIKINPMKKIEEELSIEFLKKLLLTTVIYCGVVLGFGYFITLFQ